MGAAKKKRKPTPPPKAPAAPAARAAALTTMGVLMLNPPRIRPVRPGITPSDGDDGRWIVDTYHVQGGYYRAASDWDTFRVAARVLRSELNQHVIQLHDLATIIFGET